MFPRQVHISSAFTFFLPYKYTHQKLYSFHCISTNLFPNASLLIAWSNTNSLWLVGQYAPVGYTHIRVLKWKSGKLLLDCRTQMWIWNNRVRGWFRSKLLIKVGCVGSRTNFWFEGRDVLFREKLWPLDICKEWMTLDLICSICTKTCIWVTV